MTQKNGLKTRITTSNERNQLKIYIVLGALGLVFIILAIMTVTVATRNAKDPSEAIIASLPTKDPYFFVEQTHTPNTTPSLPPTVQSDGAAWVKTGDFGSSVRMRTMPTTDALEIMRIRDREPLTLISITDAQDDGYEWYKVAYKAEKGYIRSDFITHDEPTPLPDILFGIKVKDEITGKAMYSRLDYVSHNAPGILTDLTLAQSDNFIGEKLYSKDVALIQYSTGQKLAKAAATLKAKGFQLVLWDAYRPYSVSVKMYDIIDDPKLVADPQIGSKHNRGAAVDVTLYFNGKLVDMPTALRVMDTNKASRSGVNNAYLSVLTDAMVDAGFVTYVGEWWHFNDSDWEDYPVMDFPLSMF